MTTAIDYAEGFTLGEQWAEADRRDGLPSGPELALLEEEARGGYSRWSRAFYLGALRGYRGVVRTRRFVRDADGEATSARWGI